MFVTRNPDAKKVRARALLRFVATACRLKPVVRGKLQVTLHRPNAPGFPNLTESGIVDVRVRIAVADDVEGVERVELKSDDLLFVGLELLKRGHIDVHIAWPTDHAVARRAKCIGSWRAERA